MPADLQNLPKYWVGLHLHKVPQVPLSQPRLLLLEGVALVESAACEPIHCCQLHDSSFKKSFNPSG